METAMARVRTIEIDADVHRVIENERRGSDEPPNAALRRLLKLPDLQPTTILPITTQPNQKPWVGQGAVLPHGTKVRMKYSGRHYEGEIVDGFWVVGSKKFNTPSGAASGVAKTKSGKLT